MRRNQKESPLKCDEIKKGRPARIRSLFPEIVNINNIAFKAIQSYWQLKSLTKNNKN